MASGFLFEVDLPAVGIDPIEATARSLLDGSLIAGLDGSLCSLCQSARRIRQRGLLLIEPAHGLQKLGE